MCFNLGTKVYKIKLTRSFFRHKAKKGVRKALKCILQGLKRRKYKNKTAIFLIQLAVFHKKI